METGASDQTQGASEHGVLSYHKVLAHEPALFAGFAALTDCLLTVL